MATLEAIDILKTSSVASHDLRNRAITEYHDLLADAKPGSSFWNTKPDGTK